MAGRAAGRSERRLHRQQGEPAGPPDQREQELGGAGRGDGRDDEGQLEPVPGRPPAPGGVQQPDEGQRHDRVHDRDLVGDGSDGEQHPARAGRVPAAGRALEQQEGAQDQHLGADVVRRPEQHVDAVAGLRRDHDPGRDQRPGPAFGTARPPPRQERGEHDEQRVRQRGGHVQHAGGKPARQLHGGVLGQLGGVERDVGERPAAQQPVAVQQVPGLEGVGRAVRPGGKRRRQPQVAAEEPRARRAGHGEQQQPPPGPARRPGPAARALADGSGDLDGHPIKLAHRKQSISCQW